MKEILSRAKVMCRVTLVKLDNVSYRYPNSRDDVLRGVSLTIQASEEVALVGHSGAGKSTLAKLLAGLLEPTAGSITITNAQGSLGRAGLVFQNPENQLVGLTVEEDVAFGPGNLGLDHSTIAERVDEALAVCGLTEYRTRELATLSGGEKQRVAIAGALAMHPSCLILDEATAMLDQPAQDVLNQALRRVKDRLGISILRITHSLDEALRADRVAVLYGGTIVASGNPWDVLWDPEQMQEWQLLVPSLYRAARKFASQNIPGCREVRTPKELAAAIWTYVSKM